MKTHSHALSIAIAVLVTLPGIYMRFADVTLPPPLQAFVAGVAILGASFLVLWACDVVQTDVSQTLALALVALIAVLPEYAVDMYFTWQAGQNPASDYAHYAIANMTGANRLLIGVGWVVIVVIAWLKTRAPVTLGRERAIELFFLGSATVYAFLIPLKGNLAWYDGLVFMGLFIWYIVVASRRPCTECELTGPAELIGSLPAVRRRIATVGMFLFAAGAIIANSEPFCEGLVGSGKEFGINEFLLVQWLAPLASEAPEFTVAIIFASRKQAGMALGSLLSAKLNQWTLLVGMIPGVYALSSRQLALPIPMNTIQMHEILLTAAQSLLGLVLLAAFRLTLGQAIMLLALFLGQFFLSPIVDSLNARGLISVSGDQVHVVFSVIYVVIALYLMIRYPYRIRGVAQGFRTGPRTHAIPAPGIGLADESGEGE